MRRFAMAVLALFAFIWVSSGCSEEKKNGSRPNVPSIPLTEGLAQSPKGSVVAELNGQPITDQEVMAKIKPRLTRIENQIFDMKRDAIDEIIEERLLEAEAKKRNLSVQDLLKVEVEDKVGEVTDKEIEDFYNQNKARIGNRSLEEIKPLIAGQLKGRKTAIYRSNLLDRLTAKVQIDVYIERPAVEVNAGRSPSKGPENAPVILIEFTDFQCPFCARARPAVNEILESYKGELRYVQRNFPLDFHSFARKAAVAALCANEQGKYWDYTQKLWDNQRAIEVASLKKYAAELKLDTKQFNECLDSDKTLAEVNADMEEAAKAGVAGTPAFFINGKMLTGAQPPEAFKKMIDQELRNAKRKKG